MSKTDRIAEAETFLDVEKVIYRAVHRFVETHGGDFEDSLGIAHEAYIEAFRHYNRKKGPFTRRLRYLIRVRLADEEKKRWIRDKARPIKSLPMQELESSMLLPSYFPFWLIDFADRLTKDALTVTKLVLEGPLNLRLAIAERGDGSPRNIRAALREILRDWGWTSSRVTTAFEEIGKALDD